MLGKGFFFTESHNPDFPPETYDDLVYENTTAGNYSTALDWGKYKIVFSGGGGSGAAIAYGSTEFTDKYANNGSNGEQKTIYVNVGIDETKTISGIVASGGKSSTAKGRRDKSITDSSATAGNAGTGYANGTKGGAKRSASRHKAAQSGYDGYAAAGGSGGGSTSVVVDSDTPMVARGGNGGNARIHLPSYIAGQIDNVSGGTGGSGGVSSGTGASGGTRAAKYDGTATSGAGANGYIRIYKSNLKPEPL